MSQWKPQCGKAIKKSITQTQKWRSPGTRMNFPRSENLLIFRFFIELITILLEPVYGLRIYVMYSRLCCRHFAMVCVISRINGDRIAWNATQSIRDNHLNGRFPGHNLKSLTEYSLCDSYRYCQKWAQSSHFVSKLLHNQVSIFSQFKNILPDSGPNWISTASLVLRAQNTVTTNLTLDILTSHIGPIVNLAGR